jgi:hypothetical protein
MAAALIMNAGGAGATALLIGLQVPAAADNDRSCTIISLSNAALPTVSDRILLSTSEV